MITFKRRCRRSHTVRYCVATAASPPAPFFQPNYIYSKIKFIPDEDARGTMKGNVQIRQLKSGIVLSEANLFDSDEHQ